MRQMFECPARYAPELQAVLREAFDRIAKDERDPAAGHVAPFMVEPTRTGSVRCTMYFLEEAPPGSHPSTRSLVTPSPEVSPA